MVADSDPMDQPLGAKNLIGSLLQLEGRPSRIDSEYYQAKLQEENDSTGTDDYEKSLLLTVRKIKFVGASDMVQATESEQLQMYVKYSQMLTNLMDESRQRKAPLPIRAPAQICVAAIVAAELVRRGIDTDTLMILVEHLLEQLEYAAAYYLDAKSARKCTNTNEMLDLLHLSVAEASDSNLAASAALVVAFSDILYGVIGMKDLNKALAVVDEKAPDALWYFLDKGYRFFGLPPAVCKILEDKVALGI